MNRSRLLHIALMGCGLLSTSTSSNGVDAATATLSATKDTTTTTTSMGLPRRERHLDFMDAATLAYYLGVDETTGDRLTTPPAPSEATHNVAVMFYAQWDRNSHALAPIWDQIGQITKAGTQQANLLLGLFDCELDQQHLALCHAAGVTHYPTLMFMSPSRTFPHKPSLNKKHKALPHTTQFQGIWQYDQSILDWLHTMQGMAGWSAFWNKKDKGGKGWWQAASYDPSTADALPVGVPASAGGTTSTTTTSSLSSGSSGSMAQQTAALKEAKAELKQYEELIMRSSILLDATLFPVAEETSGSTDLFTYLYDHQGWDATDASSQVMRTCAMEIALDYCTRLTTHQTTALIAAKTGVNAEAGAGDTLETLEAELKTMIATAEPFCDSLEACIVDGFSTPVCRPVSCPFQKEAACHYLSSCFDTSIQQDYATAMGLTLPTATTGTASTGAGSSKTATV